MNGLLGLFPNALYIARREYRSRVQGRAFLVTTLLIAVGAFLVSLAPVAIQYFSEGAQTKIGLVAVASDIPADAAAVVEGSLTASSGAATSNGQGTNVRRPWVVEPEPDLTTADAARKDGRIAGVLVVCRADSSGGVPSACAAATGSATATDHPSAGDLVFVYRSATQQNSREAVLVRQASTALALQDRFRRAGIDPSQQAKLFAAAPFSVESVGTAGANGTGAQQGAQSEEQQAGRFLVAYALIILIFMVIIGYGNWVAVSVAEEKNSRVMELMLSAARPTQMLLGKVVGNGLAGFTQYLAVLAGGGLGLLLEGQIAERVLGQGSQDLGLGSLTPGVLAAFGVFFVLGFALYALLYAAAGSMVSRQEDVQQAAMPLLLICMVGYLSAVLGLASIDAPWIVALSFVPFFSPYLMLARLETSTVAPWELVVCLVLLVVTIGAALWVAARIYRAGVLLYGQRVGFRRMIEVAWRG